jgi:phosphoadenosine phosphosulfate reductase
MIKLHPMLEWAKRDIYHYIKTFDLPKHPLENEGYVSIGCVPCTYKWTGEEERGGR